MSLLVDRRDADVPRHRRLTRERFVDRVGVNFPARFVSTRTLNTRARITEISIKYRDTGISRRVIQI